MGVALAAYAVARMNRLHRSYALLQAGEGRETIVDVMGRTIEEFHELQDEVARLQADLAATLRDLSMALRHVSVVRYDAFGDMGGRLSFSAAMLDDGGDGLVLTAIHGRSETRSYMKGVKGGQSDASLSPEEQQAITFALRGASS